MSDMQVEMDIPRTTEFVRETLTLANAIHEYVPRVIELAATKWNFPPYRALRKLTGKKHFTRYQETIAANG